jgi:hypothetical protein
LYDGKQKGLRADKKLCDYGARVGACWRASQEKRGSTPSRTEYVDNFVGKSVPLLPNLVFSRLGYKTMLKRADKNTMKSMGCNDASMIAKDFSGIRGSGLDRLICGYCSRKRAGKARFY